MKRKQDSEVQPSTKKRYRQIRYDKLKRVRDCNCNKDRDDGDPSTDEYNRILCQTSEYTYLTRFQEKEMQTYLASLATLEYPCDLKVQTEHGESLFALFRTFMVNYSGYHPDDWSHNDLEHYINRCLNAMFEPCPNTRCPKVLNDLVETLSLGELLKEYTEEFAPIFIKHYLQRSRKKRQHYEQIQFPRHNHKDEIILLQVLHSCVDSGFPISRMLVSSVQDMLTQILFESGDCIGTLVAYWSLDPAETVVAPHADSNIRESHILAENRAILFRAIIMDEKQEIDMSQTCKFDLDYFSDDPKNDVPKQLVYPFQGHGLHKTNLYAFCEWVFSDQPWMLTSLHIAKAKWMDRRKSWTRELSKWLGVDELVFLCLSFLVANPAFGHPEYVIISPDDECH
jgi:hypothetical protein